MASRKGRKGPSVESVLVVGDAHWGPGQELQRAHALAAHVRERQPDHLVLIGDWAGMDSLSSYDRKGGRVMEGRRVVDDERAGRRALEIVAEAKLPHLTEGNHEFRIKRWWDQDAQAEGVADLQRGWKSLLASWTDYGEYLDLAGLAFTHIPFNKVGPISGGGLTTSVAQKVASQAGRTVVFGHTHVLDVGRVARAGQPQPIYAINVGCFIEPRYDPGYMQGRLKDWWRGIVWLHVAPDGSVDLETVGLGRLIASLPSRSTWARA